MVEYNVSTKNDKTQCHGITIPGLSLKCYSDLAGLQWTNCDQRKGFRTCYTKYDPGKQPSHAYKIEIKQIYMKPKAFPHHSKKNVSNSADVKTQ